MKRQGRAELRKGTIFGGLNPAAAGCWTLVILALLALTGVCPGRAEAASDQASLAQVKKESRELLRDLQHYTAAQREEATRKTKETLDKLDQQIDDLETNIDNNWDKMDQASREKARASLKELRRERVVVAEWYGRLKVSSAKAWGQMKKGFVQAYSAFRDSWEKSENDFGAGKNGGR